MTNAELNLAIAKLALDYEDSYTSKTGGIAVQLKDDNLAIVDYCDNWNDLIPLMIKHNVQYMINSDANQTVMARRLLEILEQDNAKIN